MAYLVSLERPGGLMKLTNELKKAKVDIAAIQESGYNQNAQTSRFNGYTTFHSSNSRDHVLGTAFMVATKKEHLVLDFRKVNERLCVLRLKGRFKNYSVINVHAPHNESVEGDKDDYYEALARAYDELPAHDIKIVIGDFNAKVGKEEVYRPTIGRYSLHENTNENAETFADNISTKLQQLRQAQPGDTPPEWLSVSDVIKQEAIDTLGYQRPNDFKTWFDAECADVTDRKNAARIEKESARTRERKTEADQRYKDLRREEKRLHRRKKKELEERTLLQLERLCSANESRKFYKRINNQRRGFNSRMTICRAVDGTLLTAKHDVLERFKEHFSALLNGDVEDGNATDDSFLNDDGRIVSAPTLEEVSAAISSLKNNKASGPDNIPAELLKMGGEELAKVIYELVERIWNNESLPDQWLEGAILPLHKKGDRMICENYRGIALLNTAYKVFARVTKSTG
ncbi:uncharacterized protein LOC119068940 [Bradysia coprophila]|uniref:uncharacterized protein LOC119068940 n=1 Tax=Bradysia coprophila TaxID=38358 RepID=UPI00187DD7CF|nr:uncharacterized protein LOC119068940 [Bradysia coprophila]